MKLRIFLTVLFASAFFSASADPPNNNARSKFYDFGAQVIDGEIKRPTGLYVNNRRGAQFNRLLRLKRSFLPRLFESSKNRVFK